MLMRRLIQMTLIVSICTVVGCFPTVEDIKQIVDEQYEVHEAHDKGMGVGFTVIADAVNANTEDIAAARAESKAATEVARENNANRVGEVGNILAMIEDVTGMPPFMQTLLTMLGVTKLVRSRGSKQETEALRNDVDKLKNGTTS